MERPAIFALIMGGPVFESSAQLFACPNGHTWRSDRAITVSVFGAAPVPICPHCVVALLGEMCPARTIVAPAAPSPYGAAPAIHTPPADPAALVGPAQPIVTGPVVTDMAAVMAARRRAQAGAGGAPPAKPADVPNPVSATGKIGPEGD